MTSLRADATPRRVIVTYHREGDLWWAESNDLPNWAAAGGSEQECRQRVHEGIPWFLGEGVEIVDMPPGLRIPAGRPPRLRTWSRRWGSRLFALHLRLAGELDCGCHWHPTYGPVVMGGCVRHD